MAQSEAVKLYVEVTGAKFCVECEHYDVEQQAEPSCMKFAHCVTSRHEVYCAEARREEHLCGIEAKYYKKCKAEKKKKEK